MVLLAVLGSALVGAGQVSPDLEQGMKPYGSYHGGAIDQVGLNNQNLFLHASLMAYSQRGGELAYPIVLRYNNKNFSLYVPPCPPPSKPGQGPCPFRIVFNPNPFANNSVSHGNSVTVGFEGLPGGGGPRINTGLMFNRQPIFVQPFSLVMPDGSLHQMVTTDSGAATTDGSGFGGGGAGTSDSNGTIYGNSAEDRNGNQLTATTDTLGRPFPATPAPTLPPVAPNPSTASLSACPALNYSNQVVTFAYTWSLPTVNGGTLPLILCYASVYVRTNFLAGLPNAIDVNNSFPMLQSVIFPDNTYWAFQYDAADPNNTNSIAFGDLLKVTFPIGGSITYTWGKWSPCSSSYSRGVQTRTVDANDGTGPHTWTYANGVVTDPAGNDTVHTFTGLGGTCSQYETQTQFYQGSHTGGTLLKTVKTDYQFTANPWDPNLITQSDVADSVTNVFPIRVTTVLPNGLTSKVETDYDAGFTYHGPLDGITTNQWTCYEIIPGDPTSNYCEYTDFQTYPVTNYTASYGKALATREYDWGATAPGPLLRQTLTTYQWQVNSAYLTANMLNPPATVKVLDGAGHLCAETDYFYDEPGYLTTPSPAITTQHTTTPWTVRGNLTTVTHKLSATPCAASATWTSISSHTNWYDTGEAQSTTDPLGHTTTHFYDSAYAGAYSTKTCNALSQCVSGTYDFNTGLLTSLTDANATQQASGNTPGDAAHTSNFNYDTRWRMTSVMSPPDPALGLSPETDFDYSVLNQVKRSKRQDSTHWIYDYAYFDGVGRTKQTRLVDPAGDDFVDITYNVLGQSATASNPHRSAASTTDGVTQTQYDALDRVTQVTKQDGSISTVSYSANCVTATDEAGKSRKSCSDGLGRLTQVWEDPAGLNYETDYQYDTLGNLLRVDQKGSAPTDSGKWRTRLFTYNSLSQLLTANNPESGTITYNYDADGNMTSKTSPAPNQSGSATITANYVYDALHRLTSKSYSDSSPTVSYLYDSVPWYTSTNSVGRLVETYNGVNDASFFRYDAAGRVVLQNRYTPSNQNSAANPVSASYNLAGDLTSLTYPDGEVVTYTPNAAGRIQSVVDSTNNINYVTGATYGPDSALTGFVSGASGSFAGINNTYSYNKRLQPVNMSASSPSQTVFSIGYDFHLGNGTSGTDNGNVWGITNYKDSSRNQSFTYDTLNRLTSAQNAGTNCATTTVNGKTEYWGNSYGYDAWGNLLAKTVTKCSAENLSIAALTNNRLTGYTYDAAGNMSADPTDGVTLVYDAENRISTATKNGATTSYTYDADGERVRKDSGGPATEYLSFNGQTLAEKNLNTGAWTNYVFFDGERVARREAAGVFNYFSDHLKTASVITDSAGNIKSESDYYPWGGELQFLADDSNHYKFTGKERDAESGLDYFGARYYSNGLGRFISADWSATPIPVPYADFGDPQSLNQYSYVRNLPTTQIDADGHCCAPYEIADKVDAWIDMSVKATQDKATAMNPVAAFGNTFVTGSAGDVVKGFTSLLRLGQSVGSLPENSSTTDKIIAGAEEGGRVGGIILAVVGVSGAKGAPEAPKGADTPKAGTSGGPRAGKDFTPNGKAEVKTENAAKNGGQTVCEGCGQRTVPGQQSQKGVTPPGNETHVDHIIAKSKGGDGSPSNGQVLCRTCNLEKSDH